MEKAFSRRATEPFQSGHCEHPPSTTNQFRILTLDFVVRDASKKAWRIRVRGGKYQFDHSSRYWCEYWS